MDKIVAVKWMQVFNQKVEAEKDHLSELDGPIGDGDHGANLARGKLLTHQTLKVRQMF